MSLIKRIYYEYDLKQFALEKNWLGQGTKERPYIIESSQSLPLISPTIISSQFLYLQFKNCNFENKNINFDRCKNLKIEDCKFNNIVFSNSSEIILKNCSFSNKITLRRCQNATIEQCNILSLELDLSFNNYIKRCRITKLFNYLSRGNTLENNDIPQIYIKSFIKGSSENRSKFHLLVLLFAYIGSILFGLIFLLLIKSPIINFYPSIVGIAAIPFICLAIIAYSVHHPKFKEAHQFPPNKII
jgi:hypothetical protein